MAVADTALYKALSRLAIPQDVLLWDPSLDVSNEFALLIHICDITLVELIGHLIDAAQTTVSRSPLGSCYTIHFPPVADRHKHSRADAGDHRPMASLSLYSISLSFAMNGSSSRCLLNIQSSSEI